jgi:hypothetical protein
MTKPKRRICFLSETKNQTCDSKTVLHLLFGVSQPTVCVTCVWAGVDNAWEQEKPEARKRLLNRAESHTSGARFVGWRFCKSGY